MRPGARPEREPNPEVPAESARVAVEGRGVANRPAPPGGTFPVERPTPRFRVSPRPPPGGPRRKFP